jgi:S-adenosyl-L-methionine hydrolase (adenosine-forming)
MNKSQIITLLTDFGHQDVYVGVLKGVILEINPHLTLVDLCHEISPQDIASGSFQLGNAYPYFPKGTIHLAVVDPGVGSQRRGVAIQTTAGYLIGPDNGLFSHVLAQTPAIAAATLTNPTYWRTPNPSTTFHGRDIFAAVAAHLANGIPCADLGHPLPVDALVRLPLEPPRPTSTGWQGYIQAIDAYGNLITNLSGDLLQTTPWQVELAAQMIEGKTTYSESTAGQAIALVGSHGWLEIAVTNGNAQQYLGVAVGDPVQLQLKPL